MENFLSGVHKEVYSAEKFVMFAMFEKLTTLQKLYVDMEIKLQYDARRDTVVSFNELHKLSAELERTHRQIARSLAIMDKILYETR